MGESGRQAAQGGEVFRPPQGSAVLVQGAFDAAQGGDRVAEFHGHGWRPRRGGFERGDAVTQDR
jgi:hypothetical protein